jgi:peptide-methionine (R)-S-oxide reductase
MSRINETLAADRRRFIRAAVTGGAVLALGGGVFLPRLFAADSVAENMPIGKPGNVLLEVFSDDGKDLGAHQVPRLILSDAQWKQRLSPASFDVLRRDGTERAFSGDHEKPAVPGLFRCAGCATALYDAATEFDSGTGWPSFWQPIAKLNVIDKHDNTFGMDRVEIRCANCDSHLGHVFDDGPQPTGLRYCMNAVALRFVPRKAA